MGETEPCDSCVGEMTFASAAGGRAAAAASAGSKLYGSDSCAALCAASALSGSTYRRMGVLKI